MVLRVGTPLQVFHSGTVHFLGVYKVSSPLGRTFKPRPFTSPACSQTINPGSLGKKKNCRYECYLVDRDHRTIQGSRVGVPNLAILVGLYDPELENGRQGMEPVNQGIEVCWPTYYARQIGDVSPVSEW